MFQQARALPSGQARLPAFADRAAARQGRVWSGRDALGAGLVDALGGLARAVAILKDRAGIPAGDQARARAAHVSNA
jgi:ClpP class serine protease